MVLPEHLRVDTSPSEVPLVGTSEARGLTGVSPGSRAFASSGVLFLASRVAGRTGSCVRSLHLTNSSLGDTILQGCGAVCQMLCMGLCFSSAGLLLFSHFSLPSHSSVGNAVS